MIKLGGLVNLKPLHEAEEDKYTHIGYGKYKEKGKEDDEKAPTFKKDGEKFVPISNHAAAAQDADAKDTKKVNIFNKDKEEPKNEPKSQPSNSFSEDEIDDALENSVELDDFLDDNKDKLSREDFLTLKTLKGSIQQLEGDLIDAEMDDDEDQMAELEDEIENEKSKVGDILNKYKTKAKPKAKTKSEPKSKPSQAKREGNPKVNKAVHKEAEKVGLTPEKLGEEEYQKQMIQAAVTALVNSNFFSEARQLIAALEGKPEWAEDPRKSAPDIGSPEYDEWKKTSVWSSKYYDASNEASRVGETASFEAGWKGVEAVDGIANALRQKGFHELADKIQSVIKENKSTRLKDLLPEALINEGTRSQVGIIKNGKIISAYVHYDGYPSNMKPGLKKHMKDAKDVMTLIKKGGARGIFDDKDEIEYYKSGTPLKGDASNIEDYIKDAGNEAWADYVYLYNTQDKKWYYADVYKDKKLKKLF